MATREQGIFMLKPDGKHHQSEIMEMVHGLGDIEVVIEKEMMLTKNRIEALYPAHVDKPYFPAVVEYLTSGLVVVYILRGPDVISRVRKLLGATWPAQADPDTIRGRFGVKEAIPSGIAINVAHATDLPENFPPEAEALLDYYPFDI
jgi:nucleoside-diphosphate kinase